MTRPRKTTPKPTSKTPEKVPPAETEQAPQVDPRVEMQARLNSCWGEIQRALQKHRCRLVARCATEEVGNDGKLLVTPAPGIEPLP